MRRRVNPSGTARAGTLHDAPEVPGQAVVRTEPDGRSGDKSERQYRSRLAMRSEVAVSNLLRSSRAPES